MRASSMWCKTQRTPWPTHAGRCWWTRKPPAACWPACPRRRPLPAWRRCTRRATPLPAPLAGYRPCQPEKRRWWWPCNAMFSIAARAYSIRARGIFCAFLWAMAGAESWAQTPEPPLLQPFAGAPEGAPPAPWRVVGLPGNKVPLLAPDGTLLANAYTGRVRLHILASGSDALGQWHGQRRDLQADFLASFGDETDTVPPLLAIVLGADSDNTGSASLGFVKDLLLMKQ